MVKPPGPEIDIVDLSRQYSDAQAASQEARQLMHTKYVEYLEALKALEGRRVIASYEFVGVRIGDDKERGPKTDYIHLGLVVCRQEVEVFIDDVYKHDGSVYVRLLEGNSQHYTAEQAGVTNIVIHKLAD